MAERQRQRNNPEQRREREQDRAQQELLELFGYDVKREPELFFPRTNESLMHSRHLVNPAFRNDIGMVAEKVALKGETVQIGIPKTGEPIKHREQTPAELESKNDLAGRALVYEEKGNERSIHGQIAVEVSPLLVIGESIFAFKGSEGRRGQAGGSWPMQSLPTQEVGRDLLKEFLLIGTHKKTGEQVIIMPDLPVESEQDWIRQAKENARQQLAGELERETTQGTDLTVLAETNHKVQQIDKAAKVIRVPVDEMGEELHAVTQVIETTIDGRSDKMRGFFSFNEETNTATVSKPIRLELEDYDITPFDATGQNRQIIKIDKPSSQQSFPVNEVMRALQGHELVQKEKGGPVELPKEIVMSTLLRNPHAVIPDFRTPVRRSRH